MSIERGQEFLLALPGIKHELPYSPELLRKLFSQTGEDSVSPLDEIAGTVSQDQGLTVKVLSLANSAFYGLQAEVKSVGRAISVLGLSEIRALVLALGVRALTRQPGFPKELDLTRYWEHQLRAALAARVLAHHLKADADNLFTAAMLHDLGKLLTALHRPDDWRAIDELVASQGISYSEAEETHWGLEHGLIGAMVLRSWDLPAELTEPVNWHHSPNHAPDFKQASLILCLADAISIHLQDPAAPADCPWQAGLALLKINEKEVLAEIEEVYAAQDTALFAASLA